jgi:hypothetical protein
MTIRMMRALIDKMEQLSIGGAFPILTGFIPSTYVASVYWGYGEHRDYYYKWDVLKEVWNEVNLKEEVK